MIIVVSEVLHSTSSAAETNDNKEVFIVDAIAIVSSSNIIVIKICLYILFTFDFCLFFVLFFDLSRRRKHVAYFFTRNKIVKR